MEGLSSQKDIIHGINSYRKAYNINIIMFASHRHARNEILSLADHALIEPKDKNERLAFIINTVQKFGIHSIHAGHNTSWFEYNRAAIESSGATLTTGAMGNDWLSLAEDKVSFAQFMVRNNLPVVPSWRVENIADLKHHLTEPPFSDAAICVKPVTGIYGKGFWRFNNEASPMDIFNYPENRIVNPTQYLAAASHSGTVFPLVLMPYLPGPEYSVDILADKGDVLAAVARRKEGAIQYLENSGAAFELACDCARAMKADGIVNVQTRDDSQGNPLLLEVNMRPSGGIGYTLHSGINLPGLFAAHSLGLISKDDIINDAKRAFSPAVVRPLTEAIVYPEQLTNRLN